MSEILKNLLATLAKEGPGLLKDAGAKILTKTLLGGSLAHIAPHLAPTYVKAIKSGGALGGLHPKKLLKGLHPMRVHWTKKNKPTVKGGKIHFKPEHFTGGTHGKMMLFTKPQLEQIAKGGDAVMTISPRQRHANGMMKGGGFLDSLWSGVKKLGSVVTDVGTKVGSTVGKQALKAALGTTGALGDLITEPLGIGKLSNTTDKISDAGSSAIGALGDATNRGFHAALGEGLKKRKRGGKKALKAHNPPKAKGSSIRKGGAIAPAKARKAIHHVVQSNREQVRQGRQGLSANRPPLPGNANLIPNVLVAP